MYVEQMGEAVYMQWYQLQALLGSREVGQTLLRRLVEERITVSGTVSGPVTSIVWNGYVDETVDKWLVTALSTAGRVHDLVKRICEEYENPVELIAVPVSFGDNRYLDSLVTIQAEAPF